MKQKNAVKRQFKYLQGYIYILVAKCPYCVKWMSLERLQNPTQACKEVGITTIKDLYTESEKARTPTTTPFGKYEAGCWPIFLASIKSAY